jgi:hypothetical protein
MAETITVVGTGGAITVVDVDERVEAAIASGQLSIVDAVAEEATDLTKLKKADLVARAEEPGIEVDPAATKAEIIAAIEEQPEPGIVDEQPDEDDVPEDPAQDQEA